ncbi:hypothetical protein V3851_18665 [Paenibacillus sp. M1]|uniref:Uncharacterized protein n=1 Tax=Paenibacillus haidiansis TaxID=1574488 RepID=A0ABU7VVX0_9BACL
MELIDRYVYAVTQRLPEQQREEIRKELYGLIEDMLESRSPDGEASPEDVEEVLLELGDPSVMAAKYRGNERYLIGPDLFESYLTTIKIVMGAILIALTVVFLIEMVLKPPGAVEQFTDYLVSLISTGAQGFVWVTLVYALIEYGIRHKDAGTNGSSKKWHPSNLPVIPLPEHRIKLSDPIFGIIFTILITVLFLFNPELIGVYLQQDGVLQLISLMNPDVIGKYVPYIVILGILGVLKETYKIITRRRTRAVLVIHICFSLITLIFAGILLNTAGFWNAEFLNQLQAIGLAPQSGEDYEVVKTIWLSVTNNLFYLIILMTVVDVAAESYKWLRSRRVYQA